MAPCGPLDPPLSRRQSYRLRDIKHMGAATQDWRLLSNDSHNSSNLKFWKIENFQKRTSIFWPTFKGWFQNADVRDALCIFAYLRGDPTQIFLNFRQSSFWSKLGQVDELHLDSTIPSGYVEIWSWPGIDLTGHWWAFDLRFQQPKFRRSTARSHQWSLPAQPRHPLLSTIRRRTEGRYMYNTGAEWLKSKKRCVWYMRYT